MDTDVIDLYRRGSDWAIDKVAAATDKLDEPTPCDEWNVRALLNHMLETQRFFVTSAQGGSPSFPSPIPPALIGDNPVDDFRQAQSELIGAYSQEGALEKLGPGIGIAFSDMLLHGCDLARATGQDDTMPEGLADAALGMVKPNITEENRKGIFGPEIPVPDDASPQEKLLAFAGRAPSA